MSGLKVELSVLGLMEELVLLAIVHGVVECDQQRYLLTLREVCKHLFDDVELVLCCHGGVI